MKNVFKEIQTKIAAAVPAIRWVDFNLGQLNEEKPPVSWPCLLVGFGSASYSRLGPTQDVGELNVEITLGFLLRERTHSKNTENYRDEALAHLDTVDAVIVALKGLSGDTFTDMQLVSTANDQRADYRVYRLGWTVVHYPAPPESPYVPWDEDAAGPLDFCVHPHMDN
jgi:hypothetical protein